MTLEPEWDRLVRAQCREFVLLADAGSLGPELSRRGRQTTIHDGAPTMCRILRTQLLHGYVFGLQQPSLVAWLELPSGPGLAAAGKRLTEILAPHLPPERPDVRPAPANLQGAEEAVRLSFDISVAVAGIQEKVGIPVIGSARVMRSNAQNSETGTSSRLSIYRVMMPSLTPWAARECLVWVVQLLNELAAKPEQSELDTAKAEGLVELEVKIRRLAPPGSNNIRFIRAAHAAGIPVMCLPGGVFQYGWGKNARLFMSSITDVTPFIATSRTKQKQVTSRTLQMAGLPVPRHQLARNADQAVEIAERFGFPVVVKPSDRDQGVGVNADLRAADGVRRAFEEVAEHSKNILVEKHVAGKCYRVHAYRWRWWAITERVPAGVTGDGVSTVRQLVDLNNAERRRIAQTGMSQVKPVEFDDESREILAELGLTGESIPEQGRRIALKRAANVSTGGEMIEVAGSIHPDNIAMVERACKILHLDVAGVDLISEDLSKSWLEGGTYINEVNAQPQLSMIYLENDRRLLETYVHGDGTIPSVLLLGSDTGEAVRAVRSMGTEKGRHFGVASADGAFVGPAKVANRNEDEVAAVAALLIDPTVDAVLLATDGRNLWRHGLPFPVFDSLAIAGWEGDLREFGLLLSAIKPHLRGGVTIERGHPCQEIATRAFGPDRVTLAGSPGEMAEAIGRTLAGPG